VNNSAFIKIRYLDGIRYARAVLKGCQEAVSHIKELNKINVFPIPDKDTGSNLKKTFQHISLKELFLGASLRQSSRKVAEIVQFSALGYSGTVFAEFFSGFKEEFKNFDRIFVEDFAAAAEKTVERVYASFENPVEGTVLSVMKAWAGHIRNLVSETDDFYDLLKESYKEAVLALKKTPDQLDVLKKNGVVDAGGKAFVCFLEGILNYIEKGEVTCEFRKAKYVDQRLESEKKKQQQIFCVEFCVRKENLNRADLVKELNSLGSDLMFYGSLNFAKIHMRAQDPEKILSCVSKFGNITSERVLDCSTELPSEKKKPLAIVSDTTCDIPEKYVEDHDIYFVPVKFHVKDRVYTDKVDIIPEEFYDILESSPEIPKTSKPSVKDFTKVYINLLSHYRSILSIHLAGALSGTFQTAFQAAKNISPQKITVLNSKNLSVGLGLIVLEIIESLKKGIGYEAVLKKAEKAVRDIEIFIGIPDLKYLIKGGRVTKTKGLLAKILNINPILSLDSEGALIPIGKARGRKKLEEKVLSLVFGKIQKEGAHENQGFLTAVAHVNALESGKKIAERIKQETKKIPVMIMNASPALGAHAGPGTIGVAVLKSE